MFGSKYIPKILLLHVCVLFISIVASYQLRSQLNVEKTNVHKTPKILLLLSQYASNISIRRPKIDFSIQYLRVLAIQGGRTRLLDFYGHKILSN